jgi:phosphopantothenoylcysteine synthetase/decarboxylase
MKILVTAGNTLALIDKVRCITNIFTGRTGASIALCAHERGHRVTLLTSHPEAVADLMEEHASPSPERWWLRRYRTFEDLHVHLADLVPSGDFDAIIHCAAVSDYLSTGVYAPAEGTYFDGQTGLWATTGQAPAMVDRTARKLKSDERELWVRMHRAPKLVDLIRAEWEFRGLLVKFKLEVGLTDEQLLLVAETARQHSQADLMVANTLEDAALHAFVGPLEPGYERVSRRALPERLLQALEKLYHARQAAS